MEDKNKTSLIDLATTLSIAGVFLYQMGWAYLTNYYEAFNIAPSYIDLSFEKILVSTSWTIYLLILAFFIVIYHYNKKSENELNLFDISYITLLSVLGLLYAWSRNKVISLISLALYIFAYHKYDFLKEKFKKADRVIKKSTFLIILIPVVYFSGLNLFIDKANTDSQVIIANYRKDIELTLNHDNKVISGKLIAYMNNKYFILVKNKDKTHLTLVFNDSEIYNVKLLSQPLTPKSSLTNLFNKLF